jgi:hypothetical protein
VIWNGIDACEESWGRARGSRWEGLYDGDKADGLFFFSKTREMTCGWDMEFDERETNGVSLDVGWKMIYRVI